MKHRLWVTLLVNVLQMLHFILVGEKNIEYLGIDLMYVDIHTQSEKDDPKSTLKALCTEALLKHPNDNIVIRCIDGILERFQSVPRT